MAKDKETDEKLIPSGLRSDLSASDANTTIELASAKALHDKKAVEDSKLISSEETDAVEKDFEKFDLDAIDELEKNENKDV